MRTVSRDVLKQSFGALPHEISRLQHERHSVAPFCVGVIVVLGVRSMNDATAPLVLAEDSVEQMACLEVGSTIETST